MKEEYTELEAEVVIFEDTDVITTSSGGEGNPSPFGGEGNSWDL